MSPDLKPVDYTTLTAEDMQSWGPPTPRERAARKAAATKRRKAQEQHERQLAAQKHADRLEARKQRYYSDGGREREASRIRMRELRAERKREGGMPT